MRFQILLPLHGQQLFFGGVASFGTHLQMRKQLNLHEKGQIKVWFEEGVSKREIARRRNRSPRCIRYQLKMNLVFWRYHGAEYVGLHEDDKDNPLQKKLKKKHLEKVMLWGTFCRLEVSKLYHIEENKRNKQYLCVIRHCLLP